MKTATISFFLLLASSCFSQDTVSMVNPLKKKAYDRFCARWLPNDEFLILGANMGYFNYDGEGSIYNSEGAFVRKLKGKHIGAFAEETNHLYDVSPNALLQIYKKFMYGSRYGKMYEFKMQSGQMTVQEIDTKNKVAKFKLSSREIQGGANLVSWDIVELNENVFRHIIVFNFMNKEKISVVQIDYLMDSHTFNLKQSFWEVDQSDGKGWARPKLHFLKHSESDGDLFALYDENRIRCCILDENLNPIISSDEIVIDDNYSFHSSKLLTGSDGREILVIQKRQYIGSPSIFGYKYFVTQLKDNILETESKEMFMTEKCFELEFGIREKDQDEVVFNLRSEYNDVFLDAENRVILVNKDWIKVLEFNEDYEEVMEKEFYCSAWKFSEGALVMPLSKNIDAFYANEGQLNSGKNEYKGWYFYNPVNSALIMLEMRNYEKAGKVSYTIID